MTRSRSAMTGTCALVGAAGCAVGRRVRLGDRSRPEHKPLLGAAPSMPPLLWVAAASALVLACEPTAALAARAGSSRALATARVEHRSPSAHVATAPVGVLAPGSGYSSLDGSQRVRALQRRLARTG